MDKVKPLKREWPKVGANKPCPCGSKRKYKKCHGRNKRFAAHANKLTSK